MIHLDVSPNAVVVRGRTAFRTVIIVDIFLAFKSRRLCDPKAGGDADLEARLSSGEAVLRKRGPRPSVPVSAGI
jgi:hypothetical protein